MEEREEYTLLGRKIGEAFLGMFFIAFLFNKLHKTQISLIEERFEQADEIELILDNLEESIIILTQNQKDT